MSEAQDTSPRARLRIVFIVSFWTASGAPMAAMRIAAGLRMRGHVVEVWYLYRRTELPLEEPGAQILLDKNVSRSPAAALLPWMTLRQLSRFKPDTVISFTPLAHVIGQAAAWLTGVENRVAAHRIVCDQYTPVLRKLDMVLGSIGGYTRVVTVSEAVLASLDSYPARYRQGASVIHNGIDRVCSQIGRAEARALFGLPPDAPVLLAVGRLARQKNYSLLIDALARVSDVRLVIAGDGALAPELLEQATALGVADRLHLLGHVPHEAIPDLFRACDLFALASLFEGQSNALLEGMAEGMPILASNIPEQVETLRGPDGRDAGMLLPVDDPAAWAGAIELLLSDGTLRASLAAAALERSSHFSVDAMIDRFENVAYGR